MICVYGSDNVCGRCRKVTRFPHSARECCLGECPPVTLDQFDAREQVLAFSAHGPGAELHALLSKFGMTASADCKCTQRALLMDQQGCDWCEANIEEIVGWLRESAAERGLPFLDVAARLLIRRAIANARRKAAANAEGSPHHDRREAMAPPLHETDG